MRYYVQRISGTTPVTAGGTCGSATAPITATSCTDAAVADGSYTYKVVTLFNSWTATSAPSGKVTVTAAPTVSAVSPIAGPIAGGTVVTITGTNLTGATAVKFGTATATFTVVSATSVTATAPAGTAGTVDVTVTTAGGTSATNTVDKFTYS